MFDRSSYIEIIINFTSKPMLAILKKTQISANTVTLTGALFGIVSCIIFFVSEDFYLRLLSFILMFFYLVFDFIDGDLARFKNQTSYKGYFLDIFFDKIISILLIVTLLSKIVYENSQYQYLIIFFSFLPFFFQFNLLVFTNLKQRGLNVVNTENKSSGALINFYRKVLFPTHINIIFIISLGLLLNMELASFYFVSTTVFLAILRQLYIILKKL